MVFVVAAAVIVVVLIIQARLVSNSQFLCLGLLGAGMIPVHTLLGHICLLRICPHHLWVALGKIWFVIHCLY